MSFGVGLKSRRKAGIGGFHAEYLNDRVGLRKRKRLGIVRTMFSGLSLLFGALMIYIGFHYIPAFVKPTEIIKLADSSHVNSAKKSLDRDSFYGKFVGPYVDMFQMERAYITAGQDVSIRYNLPTGAQLDIAIHQCRRVWVVEIFKCQIVNEQVVQINGTKGSQKFKLPNTGFYHFSERVQLRDGSENYRIMWTRG